MSSNNQLFFSQVDILFCGSNSTFGIHYATVDDCCVEVLVVNKEPKKKWSLEMGDGTIITSVANGSDLVNYCYTSGGPYAIKLTYFDDNGSPAGGALENINIETKNCVKRCDYYLCLVDYYGVFGCSNGITVKVNGVIQNIPFSQSISNASWGLNDLINEFATIANNLGVTYTNYAPLVETCLKGSGVTLGHFFLDSDVEFLTLYGDGSCPNPQNPNAGGTEIGFFNNCGD